jgi:hypothetical protein
VKVSVIDSLPEDGRAQGFDNIGEALSISGIQMLRYMEAAELALNAALFSRPAARKGKSNAPRSKATATRTTSASTG